jgi:phospholipid/cholesterol/gamma-HCH transport system substrate-binding protein
VRRNQKQGLSYFATGLIVLILVAVGTYFGFTKSIPFRDHYNVRAVFKSANNIRPSSPVRIAGVTVGKVESIERLREGEESAVVVLRIEDKGLPIHKDAHFAIRPRIFLEGNFFVDVKPGSPSEPVLGDGDLVPVNQTTTPVQLDQILTSLQTDTREDLKSVVRELGTGVSGEGGKGYNRSIPYWESAYRDGAIVAEAQLGTEEHDLSNYLKGATKTADGLDRDPQALQTLIGTFNTTAAAFAREDRALQQAIGELPRTLRAASPALKALNDSFPALRAFVKDFRPAVRSSGPALDASIPFAREARRLVSRPELRGLVADLRPTVPDLAALNKVSIPLYEQVSQASVCQNEVILPWANDKIVDQTFPATGKVYEEAPKPLGGLAGESRSGDANGQWFRVYGGTGTIASSLGTDQIFLFSEPPVGVNPIKPVRRTSLRPDVPCETQQPPDLRSDPGPPPPSRRIRISPSRKDDYAKLVKDVMGDLRKQAKQRGGSTAKFRVTAKPLTQGTLEKAKAQLRKAVGK